MSGRRSRVSGSGAECLSAAAPQYAGAAKGPARLRAAGREVMWAHAVVAVGAIIMNRRSFLQLSGLTLVVAVPGVAWAGNDPKAFIERMHSELQVAIKASSNPKTDPKLLEIFDRTLDYDYLTTNTLGKHAGGLTPEQRSEFDNVFRELVRTSYRKNLRDPSGYQVQYTGAQPNDGAFLVTTVTVNQKNKREKPLNVDYRVGRKGNTLLVQDVVTSGVSLVRNYRSQFGRIIKRDGFEALIKLMNKRLDKLSKAVE